MIYQWIKGVPYDQTCSDIFRQTHYNFGIWMDFLGMSEDFELKLTSGKQPHNYGKSPFSMGKFTMSMAIFNSYVSLPEGKI